MEFGFALRRPDGKYQKSSSILTPSGGIFEIYTHRSDAEFINRTAYDGVMVVETVSLVPSNVTAKVTPVI